MANKLDVASIVCLACAMIAWAINPAYLLDIAAVAAGAYAIRAWRELRALGEWFIPGRLVFGLVLVVLRMLALAGVIEPPS